jgi:DNA invertase Pin-like site-specific DNA recombinase
MSGMAAEYSQREPIPTLILSRFEGRNVADQGASIVELKRLGIKTISVDETMVDDTSAGKLAANMLGAFNQYLSDSLSEKTKF